MQLTVVAKRDGEWRSKGLMNARRLTMERQIFLNDMDSLPARRAHQGVIVQRRNHRDAARARLGRQFVGEIEEAVRVQDLGLHRVEHLPSRRQSLSVAIDSNNP